MIENVYSMKVETRRETPRPGDRQAAAVNGIEETFTSLDGWLQHLELTHYKGMLEAHGVRDLFQVPGITDEVCRCVGVCVCVCVRARACVCVCVCVQAI